MVVDVNVDEMLAIGLNCVGFGPERTINHNATTNRKHFESAYGADTITACAFFRDIQVCDIGRFRIDKPKLPHFFVSPLA
jgi:hypothetical protein